MSEDDHNRDIDKCGEVCNVKVREQGGDMECTAE